MFIRPSIPVCSLASPSVWHGLRTWEAMSASSRRLDAITWTRLLLFAMQQARVQRLKTGFRSFRQLPYYLSTPPSYVWCIDDGDDDQIEPTNKQTCKQSKRLNKQNVQKRTSNQPSIRPTNQKQPTFKRPTNQHLNRKQPNKVNNQRINQLSSQTSWTNKPTKWNQPTKQVEPTNQVEPPN